MSGAALDQAETIARMRAMWPALTASVAPDAWCEAWWDWACAQVGSAWSATKARDGVAHLLAHMVYVVDPAGALGSGTAGAPGPVTSLSTLSLSSSFGDGAASGGYTASDAALAQTGPGRAFLALRATLSQLQVPRFSSPTAMRGRA